MGVNHMAGSPVALTVNSRLGMFPAADGFSLPTAWMKTAAGWNVFGIGHIAGNGPQTLPPFFRIGD
jgi:hypothetical protein